MSTETKGLIFLLIMFPIGIRYLIKTGDNDSTINKLDYVIALLIVVVVVTINI